jgi:hypothetical protein
MGGDQMNEAECQASAARADKENPNWMVLFGVYSKQFVGFPLFSVPPGTMVIAQYPGALPRRFREIENAYLRRSREGES